MAGPAGPRHVLLVGRHRRDAGRSARALTTVAQVPRVAIGICTPLERARWAAWELDAFLLPRNYVDAVHRTGAMALLLAPDPALVDDPDELLDRIDGLMLAGGADLDPATYGAVAHPQTIGWVAERDAFELALVRRAIERDLPLLGICRGMQVMNVALGGTLHQHLPEVYGHEEHRRVLGSFEGVEHEVRLDAGSLAARAADEQHHIVKSHHHQGVDRVGEGLVVSGRAPIDDLPEAIELPQKRFALGVQWHPEADETSRLIAALVDHAR
jgi:putative glutamine amidotransferase